MSEQCVARMRPTARPASKPSNRSDASSCWPDPASASHVGSTAVTALLVVVLALRPSRWLDSFRADQGPSVTSECTSNRGPPDQVWLLRLGVHLHARCTFPARCRAGSGRGWLACNSGRSGGRLAAGAVYGIARRLWKAGRGASGGDAVRAVASRRGCASVTGTDMPAGRARQLGCYFLLRYLPTRPRLAASAFSVFMGLPPISGPSPCPCARWQSSASALGAWLEGGFAKHRHSCAVAPAALALGLRNDSATAKPHGDSHAASQL